MEKFIINLTVSTEDGQKFNEKLVRFLATNTEKYSLEKRQIISAEERRKIVSTIQKAVRVNGRIINNA